MYDEDRWAIIHGPKSWEELILPEGDGVRRLIRSLFETGNLPSSGLLLYGYGGTGKSTFAELLSKDERWCEHKLSTHGEGKSSLEGLQMTLSLKPFGSSRWLVRGDEIDKSTVDFLDGLRDLIDRNDKRPRDERFTMILSSNHHDVLVSKAPEVFDGERLIEICWDNLPKKEILHKCIEVLKVEGKYTPTNHNKAVAIVDRFYPRLRKCLNELQLAV